MPAGEIKFIKDQKTGRFVSTFKSEHLRTLAEWEAAERPFKKRDRDFFMTVLMMAFLFGVILFLIEGLLPVVVIVALVFLVYVLGTVSPGTMKHQITNKGLVTGTRSYSWGELQKFWFTGKGENRMLQIETLTRFPRRLMMLLGQKDESELKKILLGFLPYEQPEKTWMDRAGEWLSKKIPLDRPS